MDYIKKTLVTCLRSERVILLIIYMYSKLSWTYNILLNMDMWTNSKHCTLLFSQRVMQNNGHTLCNSLHQFAPYLSVYITHNIYSHTLKYQVVKLIGKLLCNIDCNTNNNNKIIIIKNNNNLILYMVSPSGFFVVSVLLIILFFCVFFFSFYFVLLCLFSISSVPCILILIVTLDCPFGFL